MHCSLQSQQGAHISLPKTYQPHPEPQRYGTTVPLAGSAARCQRKALHPPSGQCATRCGAKEVPHATSVGVAWQPAVTSMSRGHRHFLYLAQTFDGNSGGAVVVGRTGEVIGLHQQLVNQAAEVVRHKLTWASAWTPWKNH
jgi:hypothetical protein